MDRLEEFNIECMLINDNQTQEDELIKEYERNSMDRDRLISEKKAIEAINDYWGEMDTPTIGGYINAIKAIPSAEPKKCKDCKWWRDSDGAFRRGIGAESQCPINREEVYEGNGYCFLFEPQERSGEE